MAKLQLLAFITLDGCPLEMQTVPYLSENPTGYGITDIRKHVIRTLDLDISFVSLVQWKKEEEGNILIEASFETISVINSLIRFSLIDEMILYLVPALQGNGIRLFTEIPGPSSWEMTGNKCFKSGICRLTYKRVE